MFHFLKKKKIYMDFAASTPVDKRVLFSMEKLWTKNFANPSSVHSGGMQAKKYLDNARFDCARVLKCKPDNVVFTSGGTESNSLAILGTIEYLEKLGSIKDMHFITINIEHPSVLDVFKDLKKRGAEVDILDVGSDGILDLNKFRESLRENTVFVSIAYVNNEIGVIQNIHKISKALGDTSSKINFKFLKKPIFHTDASQAPLYLSIDTTYLGVDLMTIDGQKIYGPKGSGLLYIRSKEQIKHIFIGGNQEFGLRPGTPNLPIIIGFTKALQIAQDEWKRSAVSVSKLRNRLYEGIKNIQNIKINGSLENRIANNLNISVKRKKSEFLMIKLDKEGVLCSTKSACHLDDRGGSYVIKAIDGNAENAFSSLRFTLGKETTKFDVDFVIRKIKKMFK